jgi:murein DD-endopeptidase MepM/ murein hydrolase activator NlpD
MAAAALAGSAALQSPTLRWLLATVVAVPVMFVVLLVLILGGPSAAGASTDVAAASGLRPGTVPTAYEALVQQAAQTCPGVTAPLLAAQLQAESGWNPRAISPAGAQGLAQFLPGTWLGEGIDGDGDGRGDPFDPADAIRSHASFMCKLLAAVTADNALVGDPIDLALAAYNAGLGAVQRYHGMPPFPETLAYVRRIRALATRYADATASTAGTAGAGASDTWVRPITAAAVLTSGFGLRAGQLHAGIDFAAPLGTPIYAACNGTVLAAGPATGFGQWVKLRHPGDVTTVYGHISRATVAVGQGVHAGELIAYSGNEGHSTGPHLHFEVRPHDIPVDPIAFYAAHGTPLT